MNKPISKAEICGIVISINKKAKKTIYHIDDGSGVLRCVQYLDIRISESRHEADLGDLVTIKGSLEQAETSDEAFGFALKIAILSIIHDPNEESLFKLDVLRNIETEFTPSDENRIT